MLFDTRMPLPGNLPRRSRSLAALRFLSSFFFSFFLILRFAFASGSTMAYNVDEEINKYVTLTIY
jgi:hypothetical protein